MARENPAYARIREEYAPKYLIAREEADLRRAEIHLAIPEVAENAQKAIFNAVEAMAGCQVGVVNIHVGGVTIG